jgi:putative flippase GtrA
MATNLRQWKRADLICVLIIGEMSGWLASFIFKNLGFEKIHLELFLAITIPIIALICLYITYLLGKNNPVIFQGGKFVTVGISNTLIDWGILNLLIFLTGITSGVPYSSFKGVSFIIAAVNSFFWNKFWTFKKREGEGAGKEFIRFLMVSVTGFGINVGTASLIVNLVRPQLGISLKFWAIVGAVIATVFSMTWNFLGYKFVVFKTETQKR